TVVFAVASCGGGTVSPIGSEFDPGTGGAPVTTNVGGAAGSNAGGSVGSGTGGASSGAGGGLAGGGGGGRVAAGSAGRRDVGVEAGADAPPAVTISGCGSSVTANGNPFGCGFAWGANGNSNGRSSYVNFITTWVGNETNGGLGGACNGCTM